MSDQTEKRLFGFTILGSGSGGNATVIHCPDGNLLLDAGFSAKELTVRMELRRIAPDSIRAILITHEHLDHIKGCRVFADKYGIPVYETPDTARAITSMKKNAEKVVLISPGQKFDLCGLTVEPFSVSHDVADAVAYTFRADGTKLGYATDLGCTNLLVMTKLQDCDALVLEANYEPEYLKASGRPLHLKRRIMGRHGHLSNQDAMSALESLLGRNTKHLIFAHLSRECNCPDLVAGMARETLDRLCRSDVAFSVAMQEEPLETCWLCGCGVLQ